MKINLALILSCVSALAADTNDVRIISTTDTHTQPGILITIDEFTRGGQTNLVCDTRTKDGTLLMRTQMFYHNGSLVGEYLTNNLYSYNRSSIISVAGAPCSFSVSFDSSNRMSAIIMSNAVMLESFSCTNGIFYPADSSSIAKINDMRKDVLSH